MGPERDDATAALLQMVRFPLLSMASLQSLRCKEGLTGLPGVVMARCAAAGIKTHMGSTSSSHAGSASSPVSTPRTPSKRSAYPYWWADFGCSIRGGTVVAE